MQMTVGGQCFTSFDSETPCIETTEIDSEVVGAEGNVQVDTTDRKHSISYQMVVEATHSLEVTIIRE